MCSADVERTKAAVKCEVTETSAYTATASYVQSDSVSVFVSISYSIQALIPVCRASHVS